MGEEDLSPGDRAKRAAALTACEHVRDGMVLGLGTGSTAAFMIRRIGEMVSDGLDVLAVPTSSRSKVLADSIGIRIVSLDDHPRVDLTIDGADEIGPGLALIKGGGGALLLEKIVASASRRLIIIADDAKVVDPLGSTFALPVEVVTFGEAVVERALGELGCQVTRRMDGDRPYCTDMGNHIMDCRFEAIPDPAAMERAIDAIPGVVETGLFVGMADLAIVGATSGGVRTLEP